MSMLAVALLAAALAAASPPPPPQVTLDGPPEPTVEQLDRQDQIERAQRQINLENPPVKEYKDPRARAWVGEIAHRILEKAKIENASKVPLVLLQWDVVNAFVTPDKKLNVTTGLLQFVESDDELACVIGHEIGHVKANHIAGRARQQMLWSIPTMIAISRGGGQSAVLGSQMLGQLASLRYGRKQEMEADLIGMRLAREAGYDPRGMADFLRKLMDKEGKNDDPVTTWLSTHPPFPQRIAQARRFVADQGLAQSHIMKLSCNVKADLFVPDLFKGLGLTRPTTAPAASPVPSAQQPPGRPTAPEFTSDLVADSAVLNGGFERADPASGLPLEWRVVRGEAAIDRKVRAGGEASLRLRSSSTREYAEVRSSLVPIDATRDYILSGFLRTKDGSERMSLGLAFFDKERRELGTDFPAAYGVYPPDDFSRYHGVEFAAGGAHVFPAATRFVAVVVTAGYYTRSPCWVDDVALVPVQMPFVTRATARFSGPPLPAAPSPSSPAR